MPDVCRRELLRAGWSSDAMHSMWCRNLFAYGRISMHKLRFGIMGQSWCNFLYYMGRRFSVECLCRNWWGMSCRSVRSCWWWVRKLFKWSDESSRFNGDSRMLHSMRRDGFEGHNCSNDIIGCRMSMRCGLCRNRNDLHTMFGRYDIFIG